MEEDKDYEYPRNSQYVEILRTKVKGRRYFAKYKYIVLLDLYRRQYRQRTSNDWESFEIQIIENYILEVVETIRDVEAIKEAIVNMRGNLED